MSKPRIVYSDRYALPLGDHVFPIAKYRRTRDRLLAQSICTYEDFVEPQRAGDHEIALVHTPEYIEKLRGGGFSFGEILRMEVPYSKELVDAFLIGTGGTLEACRRAVLDASAVTLGGGFHHAFPGHGEGFCLIHDVAVAIRVMQSAGTIRTAMTVDCDVHHGNGTAVIFHGDPSVFTFSIHQRNNYPAMKPPSDLDIHLEDRTGDEEYLRRFADGMKSALSGFRPDLIVYLAGADPYALDQLGGLALTMTGLEKRDRTVFELVRTKSIPIAVTLAGGYARDIEDTVSIHVNTVKAAIDVFGAASRA